MKKYKKYLLLGAVSGLSLLSGEAIARPNIETDTCDMQQYKQYPLRVEECKVRDVVPVKDHGPYSS